MKNRKTPFVFIFLFFAFGLGITIHKLITRVPGSLISGLSQEAPRAEQPLTDHVVQSYYPLSSKEVARQRFDYIKRHGSFKGLAASGAAPHLETLNSSEWQNIGPFGISNCPSSTGRNDINLSGRIISLAQDFVDANVMYLGAASGGLWKSVDRGKSWDIIRDDLPNPTVGTIATNPGKGGDVWIGTGDKGNGPHDSITAASAGFVYHSTDYGEHWEPVAISDEFIGWVSKIVVRPAARTDLPDVVFIATNIGVFRSENGVDWDRVLFGSFSDIVYVGSVLNVDYKMVAAEHFGSNLWYSNDKGLAETWNRRFLPATSASLGRITLSGSVLGLTNKVYANVANRRTNSLAGIWRSDNAGDSWSKVTNPYSGGQMNTNNTILMDDDDLSGNTVYTGTNLRGLYRSIDGGMSWTTSSDPLGVIHEDEQFILDDVNRSGTIYVANDGGLYKSTDWGQTFTFLGNEFLSIGQVYNLTVSPESGGLFDGNRYYIATQDNGIQRGPNEFTEWQAITCCDGMDIAFKDGIQYSVIMGLSVSSVNRIQHPTDANPCQAWDGFTTGLPAGAPWPSRLIYNGNHFYLSFNNPRGEEGVWRADNGTLPWRRLQILNPWINDMDVSPENIVVAGIEASNPVRISNTANTSFSPPSNPTSFWQGKHVSDIDFGIMTSTGRRVYVTLTGTNGRRVVLSQDNGQNFTDITGDLPDLVNARSILVTPNLNDIIYIGTDFGVYVTTNGGFNWASYSSKLPAVSYVMDMEYDRRANKIVAATYGRGVFIADPVVPVTVDPSLTYIAAASDITSNWAYVDIPLTNGQPDATMMVTQNWNPGGGTGNYNDHAPGVWYDSNKGMWAVFNQDLADMSAGTAFNIMIPGKKPSVFTHTTTSADISANSAYLDNSLTNNHPEATILVTQNWNPGGVGGTYNDRAIGVWYDTNKGRWAIFNQDKVKMPEGTSFNVYVPDPQSGAFTHTSTAADISSNSTHIDNALTNNHPEATILVTQNWNPGGGKGTYNDHIIGVWYDKSAGKWAIFNQDMAAMPEGAAFNVFIRGSLPTAVEDAKTVPVTFHLQQNYPNPFNPTTTIQFTLAHRSFVKLKVIDILGKEVATLVDDKLRAGRHSVIWDAKGLPSGIYFYRLQVGNFAETKKLTLLK